VRLALAKLAGPDFQGGGEEGGSSAMPSYAPGVLTGRGSTAAHKMYEVAWPWLAT
jgi:hypothetical protein